MDKRKLKDSAYQEISRVSKALSNPNRLEIIDYLANGEKCVEDIALQTGMSIANTSQHLQTLKKERLVHAKKDGVRVVYALASEDIYWLWKNLRDLSFQINPMLGRILEEHQKSSKSSLPFTIQEIQQREDVYFLDVRPRDEYEKGHIPKALSIPLEELPARLKEIPKNKLLLAYCRGKFCTMADEAVYLLHKKGYRAKKIEENVMEYKLITQ